MTLREIDGHFINPDAVVAVYPNGAGGSIVVLVGGAEIGFPLSPTAVIGTLGITATRPQN